MRYSQAEKMEIIRLVEDSELPVKHTLDELDVAPGAPSTGGIGDMKRKAMKGFPAGRLMPEGSGTGFRRMRKPVL